MSEIICELKTGRAAGHDGLTAEHLDSQSSSCSFINYLSPQLDATGRSRTPSSLVLVLCFPFLNVALAPNLLLLMTFGE